jgi:ACR3 family arsenite efflux pump ArsB
VLYGVFVLETVLRDLSPTLPIACIWVDHAKDTAAQSNKALSVVGTIAVVAVTVILFVLSTWYLHMRRQRWGKIVRSVGLLVLVALAVGAAVRVIIASAAFGGSPSVKLSGPSEAAWSFGQLLGMLMLILPFISALEIFRGGLRLRLLSFHG